MINSLKYVKQLEAVGIPRLQAEAYVEVLIEVFGTRCATRSELIAIKDELKTEIRKSIQKPKEGT